MDSFEAERADGFDGGIADKVGPVPWHQLGQHDGFRPGSQRDLQKFSLKR